MISLMTAMSLGLLACSTPQPTPVPVAPLPPPSKPKPPAPAPLPPPKPPEPQATPGLTGKQRVKLAIELLAKGDPVHARPEIQAFLREQPGNDLGTSLLEQIDQDPKVLLGEKSFAYKIQPGETMSILAERFLGDRFKFYALSRYNGMSAPNQAEVGQSIQIPGTAPRRLVEPAHRHEHAKSDEEVIQSRVEPKAEIVSPPPPPAPSRDAAGARQFRARGLEALNRGDIDAAVSLLKKALALDPQNPLIKRDLARAERIAAGMGSHH